MMLVRGNYTEDVPFVTFVLPTTVNFATSVFNTNKILGE